MSGKKPETMFCLYFHFLITITKNSLPLRMNKNNFARFNLIIANPANN